MEGSTKILTAGAVAAAKQPSQKQGIKMRLVDELHLICLTV
jgi:hypothetical protein